MKTILKAVGVVLLTLGMAGVACAEKKTISVIGKGEVKQKPDVAFVTLFVKSDAVAMVDAAKQANDLVEEVKKALKKYKEIKSIDVADAAVGEQQRQVYRPDDKEEGQHPEVVRRLRITMKPDAAKVYQVIDTAISAGAVLQMASMVRYPDDVATIVVYGLLKPADAELQASQLALADAKKQADSLAKLAGKKVGELTGISAEGLAMSRLSMRILGRDRDFPTSHIGYNPEEITVNTAVSVSFELK